MRIHKEGISWVIGVSLFYFMLIFVLSYLNHFLLWPVAILFGVFVLLIINFFRNPLRTIKKIDDTLIYAPADGKIVVIENIQEDEYFKDQRKLISIFMNPLNVHVNRYPVSGKVQYSKYHPGKYLVAWHPKSSTENERTTVVIQRNDGQEILLRQIAGAVAKRICCYANVNDLVTQGEDMGFIKFGSRVDIYLPLHAQVTVDLEQKVLGNVDVIATLQNK
ncbi:MAG: phosphatidylserine decarboxylase family protein [Bacteroidota bacterium]|nr:phosphatidylserine decarboxylase family protein [Bacteroidota bacterium]